MPAKSVMSDAGLAATRPAATPSLLGFIAGGERWLVDSGRGVQVIDAVITPVPLTRPWYLGLVLRQQKLLGAIDLSGMRGRAVAPLRPTERLLVLPEPWQAAVRVDQLHGLMDASAVDIDPLPASAAVPSSGLDAMGRDTAGLPSPVPSAPGLQVIANGEHWHWLDVAQLCTSALFLQAGIRITA